MQVSQSHLVEGSRKNVSRVFGKKKLDIGGFLVDFKVEIWCVFAMDYFPLLF
jgi:hypothetical protein